MDFKSKDDLLKMLNKTEDLELDQDDLNDDPDYEVKSEDSSNEDEEYRPPVKNNHICLICKGYFDTKEKLHNHGCANVFVSDYSEDLPLSTRVRKTSSFKCEMCDFSARNPKLLLAHVKNIHNNAAENLSCSECDQQFTKYRQLTVHMFKEHKIARKPEKCLCTLCGKSLIGRSNLKKHEREKHGIDNAKFIRKDKVIKIECTKCETKFETPLELNDHLMTCAEEAHKFPCTQQHCDLKWASGQALNLHLKIDHKILEIHTCDRCGKCLKKKVSLLSHIKVDHDNIKDHVCHLCGRGFARQQGLQFHIKRVHENTGKHFCDRCPFKAITRPELDIHINEVHTKAIKFHCDQCNFFCYRKGGLAAHVKNVHLKLRPHRCDACGQAFVRRKELEKHKDWANH